MKLKQSFFAIVLAISSGAAVALPYYETVNVGDISLQGGSASSAKWLAPRTTKYKVHVFVPSGSTATKALYRIYPNGNALGNTVCSGSDKVYPCFEVIINHASNQDKWVQLKRDGKEPSEWVFTKDTGFVALDASHSAASELVGVSTVRFETPFLATGYSKMGNNGQYLDDKAVLGKGPNQWACTRDNATSLIWEIKTDDGGLRDKDNTYSWYDPEIATNGGFSGAENIGTCTGGISCDTDAYIKAVNKQKVCGYSNWRLPNKDELLGLVDKAHTPNINPAYFPNTLDDWFWSSSPYAYSSYNAWYVSFKFGSEGHVSKYGSYAIRLVHSEQ